MLRTKPGFWQLYNELRIVTSLRLGVPTCTEHTLALMDLIQNIMGNKYIPQCVSISMVAEKGIPDAEKYVGVPPEQRYARRPGNEDINT